MNLFSELSLSPAIQKNLARNNFVTPTPVQAQSIPPALTGVDVVATAQTGTGKTLAFLLPILEKLLKTPAAKNVQALVLSPTRELAIQIEEMFGKVSYGMGIRSAIVVGGMSERTQLNAIKRNARLIIATPGRLTDYLKRGLVDLSKVETLVLDEADRMLDMGFLPAIEAILQVTPSTRQSLFFSATMEKSVERLIARHSKQPVRITCGSPEAKAPAQIDLHLYEIENDRKMGLLLHMLEREEGSFLVFARTKHGADRLSKRLSRHGVKTTAMHGDRTQSQRNQALSGFRDGRYRVLVATDVAARGIHVDSVAHVINFDLPQQPEDFIHRVGRTGRAGQRGTASTFHLRSERQEIRRIERECKVQLIRQAVSSEIKSDKHELAEEAQTAGHTPVREFRPEGGSRNQPSGNRPTNRRRFAGASRFRAA